MHDVHVADSTLRADGDLAVGYELGLRAFGVEGEIICGATAYVDRPDSDQQDGG